MYKFISEFEGGYLNSTVEERFRLLVPKYETILSTYNLSRVVDVLSEKYVTNENRLRLFL
ncbi:hypothetical protein [Peribacillus sp. Hz7]|uniref:hypothetical protein n=1 Tax=Peribacillus sp. Hz7 TaxID=3344873 RepID=UPI0035CC6D4A